MSKVIICPKEGPMKWEDALGLVERSRKDKAAGKCHRRLCEWRGRNSYNYFISCK